VADGGSRPPGPVARSARLLGFRPDAPRRNVLLALGYLFVAVSVGRLLGVF
jgi:hypothetical protein